jgi:hypothetical protein
VYFCFLNLDFCLTYYEVSDSMYVCDVICLEYRTWKVKIPLRAIHRGHRPPWQMNYFRYGNRSKYLYYSKRLCGYNTRNYKTIWTTTFFHSCTVHLGIIKSFVYPTECTTRLFKIMLKFALKFYIKSPATCFGITTIIRELTVCTLLKL